MRARRVHLLITAESMQIKSEVKEKPKPKSKPKSKTKIKQRMVRHSIEVHIERRELSAALGLEEEEVTSLLNHDDN